MEEGIVESPDVERVKHKLERSFSDDITGETENGSKGKLTYRTSFKNIKGQIPQKKFVLDSPRNNSLLLDKIFPNLQQQLLDILSNHELCLLFREFLVMQQCAENFDFFVEVELLRREVRRAWKLLSYWIAIRIVVKSSLYCQVP